MLLSPSPWDLATSRTRLISIGWSQLPGLPQSRTNCNLVPPIKSKLGRRGALMLGFKEDITMEMIPTRIITAEIVHQVTRALLISNLIVPLLSYLLLAH